MAEITLSTAVRANLLSLQQTARFIGRTQGRLSSGLAVASPIDNAVKYFQSKSLNDRASDLANRKSNIDQGISTIDTALKAVDALESLTAQMKGIVDSARSGDTTQRSKFATQLKELANQIEKLVNDASYQGLNLLNSTSSKLSVQFSDKTTSKLNVDGVDFQASAYFLNSAGGAIGGQISTVGTVISGVLGFGSMLSVYNFNDSTALASFNTRADVAIARLDKVVSNVQSQAATLANNVGILTVRSDFTQEYMSTLESGAGKLTVADLNQEGANLLALQTRQQLGIQALSFAGQAEQSILGLFR